MLKFDWKFRVSLSGFCEGDWCLFDGDWAPFALKKEVEVVEFRVLAKLSWAIDVRH